MYKTVITFKDGIPEDVLTALRETAEGAFDNRLGKAVNISDSPFQCVFEGDEPLHSCLHMGNYMLDDTDGYSDYIRTWEWFDSEYPHENHSVLEAYEEIAVCRARMNKLRMSRTR